MHAISMLIGMGPVPDVPSSVLVIDRRTGDTVVTLEPPPGDDLFIALIRRDLETMAADDFANRWLNRSPHG